MPGNAEWNMILDSVGSGYIEIGADQAIHAQGGNFCDLIDMLIEKPLCFLEAVGAGIQNQSGADNCTAGEAASRRKMAV